jgi:hypothetical protein
MTMSNKSFCSPEPRPLATNRRLRLIFVFVAACILAHPQAVAADVPPWMHNLVAAPVPEHDEKTDAVLLYSETNVTIVSAEKIKTQVRTAYKILRPAGRQYGTVEVFFNSHKKVTGLRGWCIPAQGKDYEIKDKEAVEVSAPKIEGAELVDDVKAKVLEIPASDPGNIVGYEYELEEQPLVLQDEWYFQEPNPVRESHYSLQLPPGWEYKVSFLNYPEAKITKTGSNPWQWSVSDVKGIRPEEDMPPFRGIAGQMIVSFFPPGGQSSNNGFSNWQEMGIWYSNLTNGRPDASPDIKQKVSALIASSATPLDKMRSLAQFVQNDIRYVAIELGIGGWQPHPAAEIFTHRYGDCKDKTTLMKSMLHEIGVDSYYVVINTERGSISPDMPVNMDFDHVIIAIKLPDGLSNPSLVATLSHPRLGRLLFFDPTNELTPFGQIGGYLQANWGLLVTSTGGELVELPKQPAALNSIRRTGTLTLDATGNLKGEVQETRLGDRAWGERFALRGVTKDVDKIKPIENLLAGSLSTFHVTRASLINLHQTDQPFGFEYSFDAANYAKSAGDLLIVRPRVLGTNARAILETKEPRAFAIEFDGPVLDTDTFDISLPPGYAVDDLPPPVDADFSFASYHSKSEVNGNVIHYTRSFEVKELSVPVNKANDLKKFYRIISSDERNTAVLKPSAKLGTPEKGTP